MDEASIEQISFLTRSVPRVRLLGELLDDGPLPQRELAERLETSRSTVARSLNDFEQRDWVTHEDGVYRLTPVGERIIDELLGLVETVNAVEGLSPFLRWFPTGAFDLDITALADATVVTPSEGDPYAPARTQTKLLRATGDFRGIFPSIDLEGSKFVHEQITNGRLEAEIVVSPSVEETITGGEFARLFREKLETGRLTVLSTDVEPPFYLGIADDETVQIGVEDGEGFPRALLEVDDERVLEWASGVYKRYGDRAEVLPVEAF